MISEKYLDGQLAQELSEALQGRKRHPNICASPYPLVKLPSFLTSDAFDRLRSALGQMAFKTKLSDLYEFEQTGDLRGLTHPVIKELCSHLYSEAFVRTLSTIIGKPLSRSKIDLSGQRYSQGHFLLCHDDRLDSRRVAMMIYLTTGEWSASYGGLLERLDTDHAGRPVHVRGAATTAPESNLAAFFEVTPYSFHQVQLVLPGAPPRLSVTCWFHDLEEEPGLDAAGEEEMLEARTITEHYLYRNVHLPKLPPIPSGFAPGKPVLCQYNPVHYACPRECNKLVLHLEHPSPVQMGRWMHVREWQVHPRREAGTIRLVEIPLFAK